MGQAIQRCFQSDYSGDEENHYSHSKKEKTVHRFLMLGIGSVGKSTIIKQLMSLSEKRPNRYVCCDENWNPKGTEIDEANSKAFAKQLRGNVIEAFVIFVKYAVEKDIEISEELSDQAFELVENFEDSPRDFDGDDDTGELLLTLLKDPAIQYSIEHSDDIHLQEYRLFDGFSYFINEEMIQKVFSEGFRPKWGDLVYSRKATVDIHDFYFIINGARFEINDIGGQERERSNLTSHFDRWYNKSVNQPNVKLYVLYVTSLSDFDEILKTKKQEVTEPPKTELDLSIAYLNVFLASPFAKNCTVLIFYNKQDRFKEKLDKPERRTNVERFLKPYVSEKVLNKYLTTGKFDLNDMSKVISAIFAERTKDYVADFQKNIYSRFTTAVDSKMMEGIFGAMKDQEISDALNDGSLVMPI